MDAARIAVRTLRRQPGFTAVVVLSLALAISLNTTMYGVLDALIHPRVDIRDPDHVFKVRFYGDFRFRVPAAVRDSLLAVGAPSIEAVAPHDPISAFRVASLAAGGSVAEGRVSPVSLGYMPLMGPKLVAGRWFDARDAQSATPAMMLEEGLAARLFGPNRSAVGEVVSVHDTSFVVVGVVSRYAVFPGDEARAWTMLDPARRRGFQSSSWIVRVRPGATRADLERDLKRVTERISALSGEPPADDAFRIAGPTVRDVQLRLLHRALIIAVLAVLLVACANVANMQVARGITRGRELALRTALGATRARIIRHLLLESVLLGAAGLVLGLLLTVWGVYAMHAAIPPEVGEYIVQPRWSWRVLLFALAATLACIVLVGVAPAIHVTRVDPNDLLKRGHGTGATRRNRRQYGYLVAAELALALALVSAAAIAVRGALYVDAWLGFDFSHLASGMLVAKPRDVVGKPTPEVLAGMQARLAGIPSVTSVSLDVIGNYENGVVVIADSSGPRSIPVIGYTYRQVTPSYIRTHGMAIVAGRDFMDSERDAGGVLVDEITARKLWPNANPVGALIKLGDARSSRPFVRVVGEYSPVDRAGKPKPTDMVRLLDGSIGMVLYLPSMRDTIRDQTMGLAATVAVRTTGDPSAVVPDLRAAGVMAASTMEDFLGIATARISRDFMAKVFTLFAAFGLGLACFGVYGVVAHSVAERRREIGVRIALAATSRDILRAVLRETVVIALSGIAAGLLLTKYGAIMVSQLSQGYDIYNAPLFALVAAGLLAVAAGAAFAPARRATRIDPTESLRSE